MIAIGNTNNPNIVRYDEISSNMTVAGAQGVTLGLTSLSGSNALTPIVILGSNSTVIYTPTHIVGPLTLNATGMASSASNCIIEFSTLSNTLSFASPDTTFLFSSNGIAMSNSISTVPIGAPISTTLYSSNAAAYSSNLLTWLCNSTTYASNTCTWASNFLVDTTTSDIASFASNISVFASNTAVYGSNTLVSASNSLGNIAFFSSNASVFASNTANIALVNASVAQSTANSALANASAAQSTANSALNNANASQSTANLALNKNKYTTIVVSGTVQNSQGRFTFYGNAAFSTQGGVTGTTTLSSTTQLQLNAVYILSVTALTAQYDSSYVGYVQTGNGNLGSAITDVSYANFNNSLLNISTNNNFADGNSSTPSVNVNVNNVGGQTVDVYITLTLIGGAGAF